MDITRFSQRPEQGLQCVQPPDFLLPELVDSGNLTLLKGLSNGSVC